MAEIAVFEYLRWIPAFLGAIAVWIVIGSVGARIAKKRVPTRAAGQCPQCRTDLKPTGNGIRNRLIGLLFLVEIEQSRCHQCGHRQSVWSS